MLAEASNQWPAKGWGLPHHSHKKINSTNNVNKLGLQQIKAVLGDLAQRGQLCHAWALILGNGIQL